MWLDTGCSRTTVRSDLVQRAAIKADRRQAETANGELLDCNLADVELNIGGTVYRVEVAVVEKLPVPVLL